VAPEMTAVTPGTLLLNIYVWNKKLKKFVKGGQPEKVMHLFQQMQQEGMSPNKFTFILVINACAALGALEDGRHVHEQIIQSGCEFDIFVGSSLVDMYAECGSIEDAQRMFNNMPSQGVVTWNALILGHVKCWQGQKALELLQQMHLEGV
jgi:pentatricopeptide repeat protein